MNLNLLYIFISIAMFLIIKLVTIPIEEYGLFSSGLYNILSNYSFVLSLVGISLILFDLKNHKLFYSLVLVFVIFVVTQLLSNKILDLIFYYNIDQIFGYDKFPLTILYFLSIIVGAFLWLSPVKYLLKFFSIIIFTFMTSVHIILKDIEVFSLKSLVSFPGGNLFSSIVIIGLVIYLLKIIKNKYVLIGSKIYGSWLVVIGIMSLVFSLLY